MSSTAAWSLMIDGLELANILGTEETPEGEMKVLHNA